MGIFTKYKTRIRQTLARWGVRDQFYDFDKNGVMHWETYDSEGNLSEKYTTRNGKKEGLYEEYTWDGRLSEKSTYKDGKLNGIFENYHWEGQLWQRFVFVDGKENGPVETYDEEGHLMAKGYYKNGERDGLLETYFSDGSMQDKTVYRDGEELRGQEAIDYLRQWRIEHGLPEKEEKEGLDFTLLTHDQVFENKTLEIMRDDKYGRKVAPTDLAVLLGGYVAEDHRTFEGDLTTSAYTTSSENMCGRVYSESGLLYPPQRDLSVRPVLSPENASKITPTATKKGVNGVDIIEYGEYPQTIVDEKTSSKLENLFQSESLQKTGKTYTFNSKPTYSERLFYPNSHAEYEYDGKKYIRVLGDPYDAKRQLSNREWAKTDKPYWVEVRPIEWLKDPSGILISKKCLISGIPFDLKQQYWGDFENTFMKHYLDTYFAKEVEPSELTIDKERKITLEGLKVRLAKASDLDRAMADTKPARTPERTELAARMHRSRRERDVIRAAAEKAREAGDEKLFEEIVEIAGPAMARAQVVERKFHERQAARRAARTKKSRE